MLLAICPNPALDRIVRLPRLVPGSVHRVELALAAAGGKGLNVARVARALGVAAHWLAPLGGATGRLVAELAAREGLPGAAVPIGGETRTCTIVVDAAGSTDLNEAGPAVSPGEWAALQAAALGEARGAGLVCLSGSLPPGVGPADYGALVAALARGPGRVWVDTSGPPLAAALAARPEGLKINGAEAAALLGYPVETPGAALAAAAALRAAGAGVAVVTLGARGAALVGPGGGWWAAAPAVELVSATGSGDSFLAGLAAALLAGAPPPEALRLACAAGAANARSVGSGVVSPAAVAALAPLVAVTPAG